LAKRSNIVIIVAEFIAIGFMILVLCHNISISNQSIIHAKWITHQAQGNFSLSWKWYSQKSFKFIESTCSDDKGISFKYTDIYCLHKNII